jgi:hypothetical protein
VYLKAFAATLSQWEADPSGVALLGLFIVIAMSVSTRIAGWRYVRHEKEIVLAATFISRHANIAVGRVCMQQATDAGRDLIPATQTVAKKRLSRAQHLRKANQGLPIRLYPPMSTQ